MLVVWLALALPLPLIAVIIRRLHDKDRSGWWLMLVPFAGLAVLVFMLLPSTPGDNRFGRLAPTTAAR